MDWTSFSEEWKDSIDQLHSGTSTLGGLRHRVPPTWLALLDDPCARTIDALWQVAASRLPRFTDYLRDSILSAAIAETDIGPVLIYHLEDWTQVDLHTFENGFMLAGAAAADDLPAMEANFGPLPESLRSLWRVHGFVGLKTSSWLVSPNEQQQRWTGAPALHASKPDKWRLPRVFDCLAISEVWSDLMLCLSRPTGTVAWDDYLVVTEKWGTGCHEALRTTIDSLLADWPNATWDV